ncbi:MAG: alpha/beta fold hydrolase [Steroidobacteraceae bacterium]|jgi:pimeloyl-ACP methyl ester carboxylesterase
MPKNVKPKVPADSTVRTRRAYFDCRFGQLHVRTAFPTTGGFDEHVTLFCLHPIDSSSRTFNRFLPLIADARSVYAPDLPGCGESDPPPIGAGALSDLAGAVADLASDLRLKQIDLLGFRSGCAVAAELARAKPELVRRLVLVAVTADEHLPRVAQPCLVMTIGRQSSGIDAQRLGMPSTVQLVSGTDYAEDLFDAAPHTLAKQFADFLNRR